MKLVMKRKLIQLSTSTNVISIPTTWLRKNNLSKGAELDLEEKDNRIIISKDNKKTLKKGTFGFLFFLLGGAWRRGEDASPRSMS